MVDVGTRLGPFEIVARLKGGGMGTLYLARRHGAGGFARHVAIKVVHEHLAEDPSFVRMFVREAKLAARIQHPHVVHVEELGQADRTWYLAMEYVHGGSLAELMRAIGRLGRVLDPAVAIHVACAIAEGLHAAHELRADDGTPLEVVHRDVSPQNVLIGAAGHVKLIDFGVAKARHGTQTTTGALRGKLAYMSPEQAHGERIDRRADVYALGVVLWEMLTLRKLFHAPEPLALLDKVRSPVVPKASSFVPNLPPGLDETIAWALAPRAADRAPTARALRDRLAAIPGVRPIGPAELGGLVVGVLGTVMREREGGMPASWDSAEARVAAAGADEAEHAVRTLTLPGARTAETLDERPGFDVEGPGDDASPIASTPRVTAPADRPLRTRSAIALGAAGLVLSGSMLALGAWALARGDDPAPPPPVLAPPVPSLAEAPPDAASGEAVDAGTDAGPRIAIDAGAPPDPLRATRRRTRRPPRDDDESLVPDVPIYDDGF